MWLTHIIMCTCVLSCVLRKSFYFHYYSFYGILHNNLQIMRTNVQIIGLIDQQRSSILIFFIFISVFILTNDKYPLNCLLCQIFNEIFFYLFDYFQLYMKHEDTYTVEDVMYYWQYFDRSFYSTVLFYFVHSIIGKKIF